MPDNKFRQIKALLEVAHNSLTKEEFIASFKNVVDLVVKVEKSLIDKTDKAWLEMKAEIKDISKRLEMTNETYFSSLKEECMSMMQNMTKEQTDGMNFI